MKKYFGSLVIGILCSSASFLPLQANNHRCDPEHIFAETKGGKATLPQCTTNADKLHQEGVEGQGLIAAIIDRRFYPQHTDLLKRKNLIHPAAFSDHLVLNPDEDFEHMDTAQLLMQINTLEGMDSLNEMQAFENKEKVNTLRKLIERKNKYDAFFKNKKSHGSAVMEAIHQIAPKAQLLPIDLMGVTEDMDGMTLRSKIPFAIRKAIQYGADVINISGDLYDTPEIVEACLEAAHKGIPIITSAGNDSQEAYNCHLDIRWDPKKGEFVRNPKQDLFNKLNGKTIRFIGALDYDEKGEEKVATYTQHPSYNTDRHCLFTVGSFLPLHYRTNSDELRWGTSFSTPTGSGLYLLTKNIAIAKAYQASPDELLNIMHDSGRNVNYVRLFDKQQVTYKSIDLWNTKLAIEEKVAARVKPSRALPTVPVQAPVAGVQNVRALPVVPAQAQVAVARNTRALPAVPQGSTS